MLKLTCLLVFCLTAAVGSPPHQRIIGGSLTTVNQYPFAAALLTMFRGNFVQSCGGIIINNRSVLCAAHCLIYEATSLYQIRVGSSFANSGGFVHPISQIINHPGFSLSNLDNDISVLRVSRAFSFGTTVQPGRIAGNNYVVADNQIVWAIGWGLITPSGPSSEQLRHVQIWTVNQTICYNNYEGEITDNMLCAGHMGVGGKGVCNQDSGGPLLHNGVAVGIVSFGWECASGFYPGVFTRVSRYTGWIQLNA